MNRDNLLLHLNCKIIHINKKILSPYEDNSHKEIARVYWNVKICITLCISKKRIWFKGRFTANEKEKKIGNSWKNF